MLYYTQETHICLAMERGEGESEFEQLLKLNLLLLYRNGF